MSLLKKRETPVQNIAYIGIMAAINAVFVLLSSLLPILFILLVFILPLTSVIVTMYCKKLYIPIYFIVTLALTFAITAGFSVFDTFIYVFPSLVVGFLFGLLIDNNVPGIYIFIIISITQYLLTYLTFIFLDKVVTEVNFYNTIYQMIGLQDFTYKGVLTIIFTYIISQMQVALTYILVKYEMSRIDREINLNINYRFVFYAITIFGGALTITSVFLFPDWALLFVLLALPITVYEVFDLVSRKSIPLLIVLGSGVLVSIFLFAFLYQFVPTPNQLSLLYILFAVVTIIDFIFSYCLKRNQDNIK